MSHSPDAYADARELARMLRRDGLGSWADEITDDLVAGSTATEILMRLRSTMDRLSHSADVHDSLAVEARRQRRRLQVLLGGD